MTNLIGQQLGNYRLMYLLGEGGFAEVYLGEHVHLGTQAAIKVLHTQLTSDDVDKFRAEARTIAHLIHPNIIRVLEFGVEGRTPFLVMDYAPNGTLRRRHPKGTSVPLATVVSYVKQIAEALQCAHDEKLIHRDVKPENMLLGRRNEVLLSDFGIALVAQSSRYQNTQDLAGTIAYMAPEQIQGKPRSASDQYALAVAVYEWLSGDRPFHGSFTEIAIQHAVAAPQPLRERVSISPAVEQVVMIALAKEPKERFNSIQAFATALEQVFQDEQATTVYRQPHPEHASSPPSIQPTLKVPVAPIQTQQNFSPQGTVLVTYKGHTGPVLDVDWSLDGKYLASGGEDKTILVWDANSGNNISNYHNHSDRINAIIWSPRGEQIASASDDGTIQIWRGYDASHLSTYREHRRAVKCIAWSPDGTHLVSACPYESHVHVWQVAKNQRILTYKGHTYGVNAVTWSADGRYIASVSKGYMIHIWHATKGKDISIQNTYYAGDQRHSGQAHLLAWAPDGSRIVSVSPRKTIDIWDKTLKSPLCTYTHHTAEVYAVAWSPDSANIISTSADGTAHIWDATTGQTQFIFKGHTGSVFSAVWSPNGTCIASASADGTVQVWRA